MIAIGVGCRKGCSAAEIVALVREALALLPGSEPGGLFSIEAKRGEAGLLEAAALLKLPLAFFETTELRAYEDRTSQVSDRVTALLGVSSVAETAALAGAGTGAVLLVTRRGSASATCAIAGEPSVMPRVPSPVPTGEGGPT